jgi:hypothetical protein
MSSGKSPKHKGRMKLLASIAQEIAGHEAELVKLRQTERKLIKQCAKAECEHEIYALRNELEKYRCGQ